ncbi:MAG: thiamine pyrophosphate-binding protein [Actinobacteria bacterium]|nr:thiamine pyrophosphate-binding protein [Actinomycetota bacterium]
MELEFANGGQAAARALIEHGVDTIFTLSGGHLNPIYAHLEESEIRLFDTRHEQAAVWMADAYGRFTRKPGVAMVTAGPGFTNALTPIASAAMAGTPLVLIAGSVGINMAEKLDLQDMRQAPVIEPMVKKALVCQLPSRIPEFVDLAFREASSGRPGPVYLELPIDVLNAQPVGPVEVKVSTVDARPVDIAKVSDLHRLLAESERPMVIAGSGAWYSDAGASLARLVESAGLPIFTSANGRGVVSDLNPYCFGGSLAIRPGASAYAGMMTDLVVLLGSRLNLFSLFGGVFNPDAKIVQVDIRAEEIGRNRAVDLPIVSDIRALADELGRVIEAEGTAPDLESRFAPWIDDLKVEEVKGLAAAEPQWSCPDTPIHPMRLAREVDEFLDRDDDMLVTDGGDATTWTGMTRTIRRAGHYLDYGLFGSLGGGVPYANAAKFLYPDRRVVLLTGDGSLGFNFMEFERAITRGLPIVVVVSNDLGWGMIRHSQEVKLGRSIESVVELGAIRYDSIVEAMGGAGFLVENPDDIRSTLDAAFTSEKTSLVNVMTDPTAVSPGSIALANVGAYQ